MDKLLDMISDIKVVIALGIIVVVLALWLLIQKLRTSSYRKKLGDLEDQYKTMKSIPLSLKMNKANALAHSDESIQKQLDTVKQQFDEQQEDLSKIGEQLSNIEDYILVGKMKKADELMNDISADFSKNEEQIKSIESTLDDLLAQETNQRQEVTTLKNRFRTLKQSAQENAASLSYSWNSIEAQMDEIEKRFSTFEEWMYTSDFDKANAELDEIKDDLDRLENQLNTLPKLLEDARGVLPTLADRLNQAYTQARNNDVYLKHLEIGKNQALITQSYKQDLQRLKQGKPYGVREHLDDYKQRIEQMLVSIENEQVAHDELKVLLPQTKDALVEANEQVTVVRTSYDENKERFGLANFDESIDAQAKLLEEINAKKDQVFADAENESLPATQSLQALKSLSQDINGCSSALADMRNQIDLATGDEDRIRKQIVKLQIIMNQMQVKIRKYKLPNISDDFEVDMKKADDYIESLHKMLEEKPMNMQLLSTTLQEALNHIYKLYNNVNNVVGSVVMVENTIVFGNRYRSTYADIDSELTKSELCFRNGEYTQALTMAIATIEKIHPGNYESMIKENADSVA